MGPKPPLRKLIRDKKHPKGSPLLGKLLSATACAMGHGQLVMMESDQWDDRWITCSVCGARFVPESLLSDDFEVVRV